MDEHLSILPIQELALARQAREFGNEGRARVCARRAAGWALAGYYERVRGERSTDNVYQALRRGADDETLPSDVRRAAARLTVTVDKDFTLPHDEDPLTDAALILAAVGDDRLPGHG